MTAPEKMSDKWVQVSAHKAVKDHPEWYHLARHVPVGAELNQFVVELAEVISSARDAQWQERLDAAVRDERGRARRCATTTQPDTCHLLQSVLAQTTAPPPSAPAQVGEAMNPTTLVEHLRLMAGRASLIVISMRDAEKLAREAHSVGLFPAHLALAGQCIDGVPIAVADVVESFTVEYDMTIRRIF